MPFESTLPQCVLESYQLSKNINGVSLDASTAQITISNQNEIFTEVHLNAIVGTQIIQTDKFIIEVWDCERYLSFVDDQYHQLDSA